MKDMYQIKNEQQESVKHILLYRKKLNEDAVLKLESQNSEIDFISWHKAQITELERQLEELKLENI